MRTIIIAIFFLVNVQAYAEPYVSASIGVSSLERHQFHETKFNYYPGYAVTGSFGYDFGLIRLETEVIRTENRSKTQEKSIFNGLGPKEKRTFFFLNGMLDFPISEHWSVKGGGGISKSRAWQYLGRLEYKLSDTLGLEIGYRYVREPWTNRPRGPESPYSNHISTIGVVYYFK